MNVPPPRPEIAPAPARDDARKPRSLADRLRLGLILLVLPAALVCVPTFVVTKFFGQRPQPKAPPVETKVLQLSLEQSANSLLPGASALGPDAVTVTVRADHLTARMKKITDQAQAFGGSASEGLSTATEKRLSVELPAGRAEAFRQAVTANAPLDSLPTLSAGLAAGGKDFVDVVIRAVGDDE